MLYSIYIYIYEYIYIYIFIYLYVYIYVLNTYGLQLYIILYTYVGFPPKTKKMGTMVLVWGVSAQPKTNEIVFIYIYIYMYIMCVCVCFVCVLLFGVWVGTPKPKTQCLEMCLVVFEIVDLVVNPQNYIKKTNIVGILCCCVVLCMVWVGAPSQQTPLFIGCGCGQEPQNPKHCY